jgi:hypothetical protein
MRRLQIVDTTFRRNPCQSLGVNTTHAPLSLLDGSIPQLSHEQLLSRLGHIFATPSLPFPPARDGTLLDLGCSAIEDEDGTDAIEKKLADASQEAKNMSIVEGATFTVSNGELELIEPAPRKIRSGEGNGPHPRWRQTRWKRQWPSVCCRVFQEQ